MPSPSSTWKVDVALTLCNPLALAGLCPHPARAISFFNLEVDNHAAVCYIICIGQKTNEADMKLSTVAAGFVNGAVVAGMVAVGVVSAQDAEAQARLAPITQEDKHCLQQNIYFEARNQSTIGQVAVAWVTLNRMEETQYPNTVCGVVWQNKQFSWTHDGKSDKPGNTVLEQRAWEDAGLVAEVTLLDWARARKSPVAQAVMYHADYVTPYWASSYTQVAQIDDHIFYRN